MRNLIYVCIGLLLFSSSCDTKQSKRDDKKKEVVRKFANITSYTGYALVFFKEEYSSGCNIPYVKLILVDEKDSCTFRKESFNIPKSIKGKCSIALALGYDAVLLRKSKEKHEINFRICNIAPDYKYYVKCWISYAGYIESKKYPNRRLHPNDSCEQTCIIYDNLGVDKTKKTKKIEYRILQVK